MKNNKTEINKIIKLLLDSTNDNPYVGKLSNDDNIIEAINLANLCKDFADKGQMAEAMNIESDEWCLIICDLKSYLHSKEYVKKFEEKYLNMLSTKNNFNSYEECEEDALLFTNKKMKTNLTTTTDNTTLNVDYIYYTWKYLPFVSRKEYGEDLLRRQKKHLDAVNDKLNENWQPCLHDSCPQCLGTGVKIDGSPCIHNISCNCPKCSPRY